MEKADMIYTPMTKAALKICFEAHKDQKDRGGLPYVFHPFHVAEQMKREESICTALLHDVLEDTDLTPSDLRKQGISDEVIEALILLVHHKEEPYMEYVRKLSCHPLAREVKTADLQHNPDASRLEQITQKDQERMDQYRKALQILQMKQT